jgi:phosphoribosylanthranilate isomerase
MQVKICGITHPEDASLAGKLGADYIGVIFASHSKRLVTINQSIEICHAARESGAQPVGVFFDKSFDEIIDICQKSHLQIVQLHGIKSQQYAAKLCDDYTVFFATSTQSNQSIPFLKNLMPLYDHHRSGSGLTFDWDTFTPPNTPWILAGGLTKDNVQLAIQQLKPSIVDVATGVEKINSTRKDPDLLRSFIFLSKGEIVL